MSYVEVNAPQQISFSKQGDKIQGVLMGISMHAINGKKVPQYTVRKDDGIRVTFLATWDLQQKIDHRAVGHPISIEYVGQYDNIEKNGNKAKKFKVLVDYETKVEPGHSGLEITDDDIPF